MSVEGISNAKANAALDAEVVTGTTYYIQLHIGHPGAAGTTSVASNSTRQPVTFAAASGGIKLSNLAVLWSSVPATETYTFFTIWDAATLGNFIWSGSISGGGVITGQDFNVASGACSLSFAEAA